MQHRKDKYIIRMRCEGLVCKQQADDFNSYIIVSESSQHRWIERGRTSVQNSRNPKFPEAIEINYEFIDSFKIKFDVLSPRNNILIGSTQVNINTLKNAQDQIYYTDLLSGNQESGKIIIIGEYQNQMTHKIDLQITAHELTKGKFCYCWIRRPSHPIIRISRPVEGQSTNTLIYESSSINYPDQNQWPQISMLASNLCNNDFNTDLLIEIIDKPNNNIDVVIGQAVLSINEINHSTNPTFQLHQQQSQERKGRLFFDSIRIREVHSFDEFVVGGLQLKLMIAIDFTESNMDPTNFSSLHFFDYNQKRLSQYETALRYVSEILIEYDSEKLIPMYAFGAVIRGYSDQTQHCYPINHNKEKPEVEGLAGIYKTYREFVKKVDFSYPTLLGPVLQQAMQKAQQFQKDGNKYLILTILTDGMIDDYDRTFERIVDCCELPISLVVIGIGTADFQNMERLNNNKLEEIDTRGLKATRDLVQFVTFNNFQNDPKRLAQEVLYELPDQVVNYMQLIGKSPEKQKQIFDIDHLSASNQMQKYFNSSSRQRQNTFLQIVNQNESEQLEDNQQQRLASYIIEEQANLLQREGIATTHTIQVRSNQSNQSLNQPFMSLSNVQH